MRQFRPVPAALILLLGGCGSAGTSAGPGPAATASATPSAGSDSASGVSAAATPSASADPAAALSGSDLAAGGSFHDPSGEISFRTPTQNIGCSLSATTASCQLAKFSYDPRLPSMCRGVGVWGSTIDLADAPHFVCATDTVASGAKQLSYGQRLEAGQLACVSRSDGVTCLNRATGHGFHVAEGAYEFF